MARSHILKELRIWNNKENTRALEFYFVIYTGRAEGNFRWCGPYYIKKISNFILSFFTSFYSVESKKHGVARAYLAIPPLCGLPWLALMMKWRRLDFTNKTFLKTFKWRKAIFFQDKKIGFI